MKLKYLAVFIFVLTGCSQDPDRSLNLSPETISKANLGDRVATHRLCASYHFAINVEKKLKTCFRMV